MDDKKLVFETAMTKACDMARVRMSEAEYKVFMKHFGMAWNLFDAVSKDSEVAKVQTKDKRYSLSFVLGFRKEG